MKNCHMAGKKDSLVRTQEIKWYFSKRQPMVTKILAFVSNHLSSKLVKSFFTILSIEEGILEAKTECYTKDKVKSLLCFRSFYDDF